jgi:hypothetical protein
MTSAMSLNPCHIMVFFVDRSNEGLKPMGLNFTRANWMDYIFTGTKIQIENFYGEEKHILSPRIIRRDDGFEP